MAHYKLLYPTEYLGAHDLPKQGVVVTIKSLEKEKLRSVDGTEETKNVMKFESAKKRFVLCKTNATTIAEKYGADTDGWIGKPILLYPTTCISFGERVECVRIKTDDIYLVKAASKQSAPGGAA